MTNFKHLSFLSFLFFSLLLISSCTSPTPTTQTPEPVDHSNDNETSCIDKNKINPDAACVRVYDPVCGCNDKTYSNSCEAEKAGVTKWTKGKCGSASSCIDPQKIDPNRACTKEYKPVCGCDNVTYSNDCMAEKAGVTKWTKGKCSSSSSCIDPTKVDRTKACPRNFKPVCGCNGETYNNTCEAEKKGVTQWTDGKCPECIDRSKIRRNPCPKNIDYVCGCDNKTYSNKCYAQNAGVTRWTKGKCPEN